MTKVHSVVFPYQGGGNEKGPAILNRIAAEPGMRISILTFGSGWPALSQSKYQA